MKLVLLSGDLMLGACVEGAARKHGLSVVTVGNLETAITATADPECRILMIDLRLPNLQIVDLVTAVRQASDHSKSPSVSIIACGPHVHEAKLAEARQAGCDAVVTRGQFDRDAQALLERLLE